MGTRADRREMMRRRREDVEGWCDAYGVPRSALEVLRRSGFDSLTRILNVGQEQMESLALTADQLALLRGALLQHRANAAIDKMAHTDDGKEQDKLADSLNQTDLKVLMERQKKRRKETAGRRRCNGE